MDRRQARSQEIIERLGNVLGNGYDSFPLHVPEFSKTERDLVLDCIETGWVSSVGGYVDQFEREIALASDALFGVAVVNGTAALELAMKVVGVNQYDEVLMPALTFVATANAVHHLGAIPHFVDSSIDTLGIDPVALASHLKINTVRRDGVLLNAQTGRRISCLVPMHAFGHPVDMDGLLAVAEEFLLPVVEDAAESLGSLYKSRATGALGRIGAVSFNGNKIITTGGGGAVITNNEELAVRVKHLSTTAKLAHAWAFEHDEVGYNYRMPNLNAALGVAQLRKLSERVEKKRRLARRYLAEFEGLDTGKIFEEPQCATSNYWLNTLLLSSESSLEVRNELLDDLNAAGYMARPAWSLMHRLPFNAGCPRAPLPIAEQLERRIVSLPSSARLAETT